MALRIAQIVYSCIPGEFRGGVPRVVYDLSRAQVQLGHQVTIYTTNYNSSVPAQVPLDHIVEIEGVSIKYFPLDNPRWFRSETLRRDLAKNTQNFDVVHSHNPFLALNWYAAQVHQAHKVPLFYHVHGALNPLYVNRGLIKRLRKLLYLRLMEHRNLKQASGIFALSHVEAEHIRSYHLGVPIHVIPNGIWALEHFQSKPSNEFKQCWGIPNDSQIVLSLGRIVPLKGIHLLIEAIARIRALFPNVVLVIVGDKNQEPGYVAELEQQIQVLNLQNQVIWTGFLKDQDKKQLFAETTIFSNASESEGMATAPLETMAAGLATIVSKGCNMSEAAQAGAVVECDFSVDSLTTALLSLLTDKEYRANVQRTGIQYIHNQHNWPTLATRIVKIYASALPHHLSQSYSAGSYIDKARP